MTLVALAILTGLAQAPVPSSGNVSIPLDEYNKLVDLAAHPAKPAPDAPPVPFILKSAHCKLAVTGGSVTGTIAIEGEVFAKGEQKVPLISGIAVLDAQQKGSDLPVIQENGILTAVIRGPREFSLTLKTAIPLTIETGRAMFLLPVPSAGAATIALSVPGESTNVNFPGGLISSRTSRDGRTFIEATPTPGRPAQFWWTSRLNAAPQIAAPPKEVRFLSDVKTLISVTDTEVTLAALAEINVVQGEPSVFTILAPEGYEMTGATGQSLLSTDVQPKQIRLYVAQPGIRNHQFLITLVKPNVAGAVKADVPFLTFEGTQRETAEVLVEADGAIDLHFAERGGLRRMDIREVSPYLRSLSHASVHAAFRYQKKPAELPGLALEWTRFPDTNVLSAVAEQAVVTTLVTAEGRTLTEVKLVLKNQSQPFLKVRLPQGARILSADVGGDKVKPVEGTDGSSRVPLLRPGFRPKDTYKVSFVVLSPVAAFEKKGTGALTLPQMDLPIGLVQWEVFLPKQYRVSDFGGDAISATGISLEVEDTVQPLGPAFDRDSGVVVPGQIRGIVLDATGGMINGAVVQLVNAVTGATRNTRADSFGQWVVAGMPSGSIVATISSPGFQSAARRFEYDSNRGASFATTLQVGSVTNTVEVTSRTESQQAERNYRQNAANAPEAPPSVNVTDLQKRVVGVLPIAITVPRNGNSYRFVRPLVVDEETRLTFAYRMGK